MHQTRNGRQWYFGVKLHIGVDSHCGLAHSAMVTSANMHDKNPLSHLRHGRGKSFNYPQFLMQVRIRVQSRSVELALSR